MLTAGIDPGVTGALVVLSDMTVVKATKLPVVSVNGRKTLYLPDLCTLLQELRDTYKPVLTGLEQAVTHPRDGRVGAFAYGRTFGQLEAALACLRIPYILVAPQTWKKALRLSKDKAESLVICGRLFPELAATRDHNLAEAALLAYYVQLMRSHDLDQRGR